MACLSIALSGRLAVAFLLALLATGAARGQEAQPELSMPPADETPVSVPVDRSTAAAPLDLEAGDPESWADGSDAADGSAATTAAATSEDGAGDSAGPTMALKLGVLPRRDAGRTLGALSGLADQLSSTLGRPVEFVPVSSYAAMIDAQVLGRIDGGFYSTSAYAQAESLCKCLEPIAVPAAADGTTAFYAVIVAPQAAPFGELSDLKGVVAAVARPDSIGGTRMQVASLLADGLDVGAVFSAFREAASPEAAVTLMLAGKADVAFAWSSLSGTASEGYSRGTLRFLTDNGSLGPSALKILWRSQPVSHGPVALASAVPDGDRAAIAAVLIGLRDDDPEAYAALEPYYSGGYEASDAEDFRGVSVLVSENVDTALRAGTRPGGAAAPAPPEL